MSDLIESVDLWVPGLPKPGGSKRAFRHFHTKKIVVIDDCKTVKSWRERVATAAKEMWDYPLLDGPLTLSCRFIMPRPKGHYGTGRNAGKIKPSAPKYPAVKPDTTKLLRAVEDALNGVLWVDDSRIVWQLATKEYGEKPGVKVFVSKKTD